MKKSPFIVAGPQTGEDILPITDKVFAGVPEIDLNMVALASNDQDELRAIRESRYNSLQEKMADFPSSPDELITYNSAGEQVFTPTKLLNASNNYQQTQAIVQHKKQLSVANPFSILFNNKTKNAQTFTLDLDLNIPSKDLIKMLFEQNDSDEIKQHFIEYIQHLLDLPAIQEKLVESMLEYYNINTDTNEETTE